MQIMYRIGNENGNQSSNIESPQKEQKEKMEAESIEFISCLDLEVKGGK